MYDEHIRHGNDERYWSQIPHRIVRKLPVQYRTDDMSNRDMPQSVAIGSRLRGNLLGDYASGAAAVIDDKRPLEGIGQFLPDDPRDEIGISACRKCNDESHRLGGIAVRTGERCWQKQHQ